MSLGPGSHEARRGFDPSDATSAKREESIQKRWRFLQGLDASGLRVKFGQVGDLLVVGENGEVVATTTISELTLTSALILAGTDFLVTADNVSIDSNAGMALSADQSITASQNGIGGDLVTVGNDAPAVAAGALGKVDLTAQVANIASTALSNTPPAGLYEVECYIVTTTNDVAAGTLAVTVGYTDTGGARTATLIAAHPLTALSPSTGRQIVQLASGNITYAVTVTGLYGTSAYAVYLRVVSLG